MSEIVASSKKAREQMWRELIAEQGQRGQSIRIFCAEHQIRQNTFHYWKRKFKNLRPARLTNRFVPVSRNYSSTDSPRIHLPNGVKIELGAGLESAAVNELIRSLCGVGREDCAKS